MEGPLRFRCPPEFEAVAGGVPLGGPGSELWLIRAPRDFCPQSLEGLRVPLEGLERLWTPPGGDNDNDSDNATPPKLYVLRGGPGRGGDCPLLLSPVPSGGSLACAPPLRGSLTITQSFGTPPGSPPRRKRRKKDKGTAQPVALGDTVAGEGTVPPAGTEAGEGPGPPREPPGPPQEPPGPPQEPEVAERRRRRKKKHKREEQE